MSSSYQAKMFTETARERTEELRKREAERYETLLRERLKERYPNPSPEQKRKIEARVQTLMERHGATVGARAATESRPCDGSRSSCNSASQPGIRIYRQISPKGSRSGLLKP
jgi:hypothetical protein